MRPRIVFFFFCHPVSSARLLAIARLQRAAGQSGPKRRAPLMAFITAAHRSRRSRRAVRRAGVKHGYAISSPRRVRLAAGSCCLCISSADHFPSIQRWPGEGPLSKLFTDVALDSFLSGIGGGSYEKWWFAAMNRPDDGGRDDVQVGVSDQDGRS